MKQILILNKYIAKGKLYNVYKLHTNDGNLVESILFMLLTKELLQTNGFSCPAQRIFTGFCNDIAILIKGDQPFHIELIKMNIKLTLMEYVLLEHGINFERKDANPDYK